MASSARLSAGALFLGLLLLLPYQASASADIPTLVDRYAARYGVPLDLARNLVRIESGGRQSAVNPTGARGVMQLLPSTARALGVDINDPEQNIEGGMRYLRLQYDRFGRWDLALAAYHAGPRAVISCNCVPAKSQAYVRSVLRNTRTLASPDQASSQEKKDGAPQLYGGFQWPVRGVITAGFGRQGGRFHSGVDLSAPQGTPIGAARAGRVVLSDWHYDYGRTVILDHGDGLSTLYGHASVLLMSAGDAVEAGQTVALVGCTGRCTGSHVHFEVRVNGRAVDPLSPRAIAAAREPAQESSKESRVIAKAQESPRDKAVVRKLVTRTKDTVTTVTDTLQQDRVVRRVEVILVAHGQLRIEIVREFRLVDGVLKLVNERTRIWLVDDDEDEDEDEDDEDDD